MNKPMPYKETKKILDYMKAAAWVDTAIRYDLNMNVRHDPSSIPPDYGNYWHYVVTNLFGGGYGNDAYWGEVSFKDFYEETKEKFGEDDWRTHSAKFWAKEYPGSYTIWMSW